MTDGLRTIQSIGFGRAKRLGPIVLAALLLTLAAPRPTAALTITATFSPTLSASSISVINTAIGFYQSIFSDPINVLIEFHNMASGLGASSTLVYNGSYPGIYRPALIADATSPDDAVADASLPAALGGPPFPAGVANINFKSADGRAVGLATPAVMLPGFCSGLVVDGCIGLHLSITNDVDAGGPPGFSLISVVEHEIDEVLGLGSSLSTSGIFGGRIMSEDLFRWQSAGVRSFATNPSVPGCADGPGAPPAFLSFDSGITMLDQFNNCNNGGDYGDWITHTPTQVQDAFTNNSGAPSLTVTSPEIRALDVIGYTLTTQTPPAVPEPVSLTLLGTGLAGAFSARRRAQRKNS